jgi:hypothetical protein
MVAAVLLGIATALAGTVAQAEDRTFLGIVVTALDATYLVTKGANVRTGPETKAKRLGTLKAGTRVSVVGRAKGGAGWMAVQKDGKDYGFVYAPILLPMIDGTLQKSISGTVQIEEHAPCGYTFEFRGKNTVEGEDYVYSDYEVVYRCNDKGRPFRILAPMFMTEVPYKLTHNPVFQISIDLMEVENGYDEIYSTTFHYLPEENKIVYAGVSIKKQGRPPREKQREVNSIAEALSAAVEIAPDAWAPVVWKKLAKELVDGGG